MTHFVGNDLSHRNVFFVVGWEDVLGQVRTERRRLPTSWVQILAQVAIVLGGKGASVVWRRYRPFGSVATGG